MMRGILYTGIDHVVYVSALSTSQLSDAINAKKAPPIRKTTKARYGSI